ncbi:oligosaccharide repeat unit polymerase [Polynucleobacter sp. MG-5-Ahmo-C2]|uniref:O-antigen polymerase n=1 Tax=Polynucleobacter sp. MG-5-Ahmo-C2 TaxID=2081051 RepID=UPI001BFE46B7|nr:O-antigen polymerase [Polynucleobacter sp. MG-5-Ahmo-C2]QWD98816.1 oligosaccharide repeat unit polymerase [Polynucleobacter sp. MG-5-Ahmo-C2]
MSNRLKGFIAIWWSFWIAAAYLNTSLSISNLATALVTFSMVLFLVGWSLSENLKFKKLPKEKYFYLNVEIILLYIILIQIVMSIFSLTYSLNNPGALRDIAYSNPVEIYKNQYILQIYTLLVYPIGLYGIASINFFSSTTYKNGLILLFFIFDTLITLGRLSIYIFFIYILINAIIINKKLIYKKIAFLFIIANIIMYILFNYRYTNELNISLENYIEYLETSVFNYHIIGFKIFDEFINGNLIFNSESLLTFGFYEYIVSKFYSIFIPTVSNWAKFGEVLQGFVIQIEGGTYNALSTIFLPYYIDFGIIGPPAFLFIFGSIIGFGINRTGNVTPLGILILILVITGMLQSTTIGQLLYIPLILILFGIRLR